MPIPKDKVGNTDSVDKNKSPVVNANGEYELRNAFSGDYNDLSNKPNLKTVATSGDYNDLSNKPNIPTVNNGTITIKQGEATKGSFTVNQSGDTTITLDVGSGFSGDYNDLTNKPDLKTVATSGSYNDLTDKPALKTVATTGSYNDLSNKPALKTVATSGSYNDLTNKPTIQSDTQINNVSIVENGIAKIVYETGLSSDSNNAATVTAIRAFVNSSIASVAAYYITSDAMVMLSLRKTH